MTCQWPFTIGGCYEVPVFQTKSRELSLSRSTSSLFTGNRCSQVSFWHIFSANSNLEQRILMPYQPSLVQNRPVHYIHSTRCGLIQSSWSWLTRNFVYTCPDGQWCLLGLWRCQQRLSMAAGRHKPGTICCTTMLLNVCATFSTDNILASFPDLF